MLQEGPDAPVMTLHHVIALPKRLTMVERCLSLFGIINYHHLQVLHGHILQSSGLHNANTPIDIGRIAEMQIIGRSDSKISTGIKSLMANEHTLTEGFPRQILWW